MAILSKERLSFVSQPFEKRVALLPMGIGMIFAWSVDVLALAIAYWSLQSYVVFGAILMAVACSFATYLSFATYRWFIESRQYYELHLNENMVSLSIFNSYQRTSTIQQLSLTQVTSAEYYPAQDTSTLMLLGRGKHMEIPLWAFGPQQEKAIVTHLKSAGINIVSIPGNVVF